MKNQSAPYWALTSCLALFACGGSSAGSTPATGPDTAARTLAATSTAQNNAACTTIRPFYWEIGDKTALAASGSVGDATYTADTLMPIASASKWLYGAYVAERRNGVLTAQDIQFLHFQSGYTNFTFSGCDPSDTVASCVARGNNDVQTAANIDKFFYNGGHMQKHASLAGAGDMNLGALANAALASEIRSRLGTDINLIYTQPQLAGGVRTTARDYAVFLRKLLNNQLRIASLLGSNPVCTNPDTCPTAVSTPIANSLNWHYAVGHWVEDDATRGDGAFSSPGAFGFYPWVDASKTWYGGVARAQSTSGAANDSASCGGLIRKAWVTGTSQ